MKKLLVLLALLYAYAGAQTINPNQIRPGTQNDEVLMTVTANQPPSWQQVSALCGVSCVLLNPTGDQNITQPDGTAFTLNTKNLCLQDGTNCPAVSPSPIGTRTWEPSSPNTSPLIANGATFNCSTTYCSGVTTMLATPQNSTTGNCCTASITTSPFTQWVLVDGATYRMWSTGYVKQISIGWSPPSGAGTVTSFSVQFWRADGSNFDLVGTTGNLLSKLTASTTTPSVVTLDTPLFVQEGDYYGFTTVLSSATHADNLTFNSSLAKVDSYVVTSAPTSTAYNWTANTPSVGGIIMDFYIDPVTMIFIGDSLMAGNYSSCVTPVDFYDISGGVPGCSDLTKGVSNTVAADLGVSVQNVGVGGQTTTDIVSRLTSDVISKAPKYVVVEAGINNITHSFGTETTFLDDWTTIITDLQGAGITPVVMTMWPCGSFCNSTEQGLRDTWNADLITLAESKGVLIVDVDKYTGSSLLTGPGGNFWGILPKYDHGDGLHYTDAGYSRVAQAIVDAVKAREIVAAN